MDRPDKTRINGFDLARDLTARADRSIKDLFESSSLRGDDHWCIIALGGYGRQELCPFSDLDMLFLVRGKKPQNEIEKALLETLYPLWDKGFNASHSVRTIAQVLEDARSDFFFRTSILDARFICGSAALFSSFRESTSRDRFLRDSRRFFSNLLLHTRKRHEKFGDAAYFLEPHIKDGRGGLRDYQTVVWLMKVMESGRGGPQLPPEALDPEEMREAAGFMTGARYLLHRITGRKTDRMHLEYQERLALEMGYGPDHDASPVESFLKDFHTRALTIGTVIDSLFTIIDRPGGLRSLLLGLRSGMACKPASGFFPAREALDKRPVLLLEALKTMAEKGLTLGPVARSTVKDFIRTRGASLARDAGAPALFLDILKARHAGKILPALLETGLIEQLIPEFGAIRGRTIFDVYHTFTVDLHSIHTVSELKLLEETQADVFEWISDRDVLFFTAFLHDIGKGYGSPHADLGAEVIVPVAERFGFDGRQTGLVVFLVKNHLAMADIASRRDLTEEKVVEDLAWRTGDAQRLSMLYLLTMADSKATGPGAWNEWKAALLRELFTRTSNILEKGLLNNRKNIMRLEEKWRLLVRETESERGSSFSGRLWALPQIYVHSSDLDEMRNHLSMSARLSGPDDIRIHITRRRHQTRLAILTRDRQGLFSTLTGVLALNRLDIISAKIFTWYDGTVVDTFHVIPPWDDYKDWEGIEGQLRDCLSGKAAIAERLARIKDLKSPEPVLPASSPAAIDIDNETSDFFSVIDVKARKRIGLVYDVSRAISGLGLDIHRAFLSRASDLASSVFYVVDSSGEKITGDSARREVIEKIREAAGPHEIQASPGGQNTL